MLKLEMLLDLRNEIFLVVSRNECRVVSGFWVCDDSRMEVWMFFEAIFITLMVLAIRLAFFMDVMNGLKIQFNPWI